VNQSESSHETREREIIAFLRRQHTAPISAVIAELLAGLGFGAPARNDTGADFRTCNVDDVLHALVRAFEAGRKAGQIAPPRECIRCKETGNVEHDCDVAICNLCTDAIQAGADSHRYDPSERYTAIERRFSELQPREPGFMERVIADIAHSNAWMAVDNRTAAPRAKIEAPITAYLENVFDTLAEFGISDVRNATLARKLYRAEVKRLKAKQRCAWGPACNHGCGTNGKVK
jgi:hypothetical protein